MGRQRVTSIRIDEDVFREAKELGLNVSKIAENALKEAIRRLKGENCQNNPNILHSHTSDGSASEVAGSRGFEPRTYSLQECVFERYDQRIENDLNNFRIWLRDQNKSRVTQKEYSRILKRSLKKIGYPITLERIKEYLRGIRESYSPDHYSLTLSSLKNYLRFKGYRDALKDFKFIHRGFTPKKIASKEELQAFFHALPSLGLKAYFMILASSGLRSGEVKNLTLDDVDFNQRMLRPSCHSGATKHSWVSFYNQEAEEILKKFREKLSKRQKKSKKLLPISSRDLKREWKIAKETTGLNLKPKDLRDWFCTQMAELGVPDRYVDAFCGRMPRSILAKHYSDYNPIRLKRIYDQAGLKVLS